MSDQWEEQRQLRKELRKHLREAAELSIELSEQDKWLGECVRSWNIVADDNDDEQLTESRAKDQLHRIDWSEEGEEEDFEENQ
jgi:hypothetical protein